MRVFFFFLGWLATILLRLGPVGHCLFAFGAGWSLHFCVSSRLVIAYLRFGDGWPCPILAFLFFLASFVNFWQIFGGASLAPAPRSCVFLGPYDKTMDFGSRGFWNFALVGFLFCTGGPSTLQILEVS